MTFKISEQRMHNSFSYFNSSSSPVHVIISSYNSFNNAYGKYKNMAKESEENKQKLEIYYKENPEYPKTNPPPVR
jgi:hypothetical protein